MNRKLIICLINFGGFLTSISYYLIMIQISLYNFMCFANFLIIIQISVYNFMCFAKLPYSQKLKTEIFNIYLLYNCFAKIAESFLNV